MHTAHVQSIQPLERVAIAGGGRTYVIGAMGSCGRSRRHGASGFWTGGDHLASLDAPARGRVWIFRGFSATDRSVIWSGQSDQIRSQASWSGCAGLAARLVAGPGERFGHALLFPVQTFGQTRRERLQVLANGGEFTLPGEG